MEYSNISSYIKGILKIGVLCVCIIPLVLFGQGQGESVSLGEDGINPLTDDIAKKIPSLEGLIEAAIENSHRLKYYDKEISIKEYELKTTKRDWANYIGLSAAVSEGSNTSLTFVQDQIGNEVGTLGSTNSSRYSVGLAVNLPIISFVDYNNQSNIAKMKVESKMEQKLDEEKSLRADVINLYNELVIQQKMLQMDIDNIEYATLTTEMAEVEYHNNKIGLVDLSKFRDNLSRARYRYVGTKINFIKAYVMLQELTGVRFSELNNWE